MYISAITFQARPGHGAEVGSAAVELGGLITKAGANPAMTWGVLAGAPYGSFAVSARFDTMTDYVKTVAAVQAKPAFTKLAAKMGDALQIPAETRLNKVVAASATYKPQPFTVSTAVVIAAGQLTSAMGWSTELLEFVERVTGHGGVLTAAAAGRVGEIGFIFSAEDAEHWEALDAKLEADPGYAARMDQLDGMFEPGSDQRVLMTQIG